MVEYKLVLSDPETGHSFQKEVKDDVAEHLKGKKIGDIINGEVLDFNGYEFKITGGSDKAGFPMRTDSVGIRRSRILIRPKTVGLRKAPKGIKKRRTVCGNVITTNIAQINLKVIKHGAKPLGEPKAKEAKEEAPKEEKKAEEKKEKEAKEEKPKEEETEKKAEEKKEQPKEEAKKEKKPKEEKAQEKPKENSEEKE